MENTNEKIEKNEELRKLEQIEKEKLMQIDICNLLIDGSITERKEKSVPYEERKKAIQETIEDLEKTFQKLQREQQSKLTDASIIYNEARAQLEIVLRSPGISLNDIENKVINLLANAEMSASQENINAVKEAVNNLPEESKIKGILLDTINKMEDYYVPDKKIREENEREFTNARARLEIVLRSPGIGMHLNETENEVVSLLNKAEMTPSEENISVVKDAINNLPEESKIKGVLIDTINKMEDYYVPNKKIKEENQKEYMNARARLEIVLRSPGIGMHLSDLENEVTSLLNKAEMDPSLENINIVKEAAKNLPEESKIKEILIDTINKMENNYTPNADDIISEIENLKNQYQNIENEQQQRQEKYTTERDKIQAEIDEIHKKKADIRSQQENTINNQDNIVKNQDDWIMPLNSQVSLSEEQLNNETDETIGLPGPVVEDNSAIDNDDAVEQDIPPVKEPFSVPKVIKSVKQAGNKLLEKIHNIDFKKKKIKH